MRVVQPLCAEEFRLDQAVRKSCRRHWEQDAALMHFRMARSLGSPIERAAAFEIVADFLVGEEGARS